MDLNFRHRSLLVILGLFIIFALLGFSFYNNVGIDDNTSTVPSTLNNGRNTEGHRIKRQANPNNTNYDHSSPPDHPNITSSKSGTPTESSIIQDRSKFPDKQTTQSTNDHTTNHEPPLINEKSTTKETASTAANALENTAVIDSTANNASQSPQSTDTTSSSFTKSTSTDLPLISATKSASPSQNPNLNSQTTTFNRNSATEGPNTLRSQEDSNGAISTQNPSQTTRFGVKQTSSDIQRATFKGTATYSASPVNFQATSTTQNDFFLTSSTVSYSSKSTSTIYSRNPTIETSIAPVSDIENRQMTASGKDQATTKTPINDENPTMTTAFGHPMSTDHPTIIESRDRHEDRVTSRGPSTSTASNEIREQLSTTSRNSLKSQTSIIDDDKSVTPEIPILSSRVTSSVSMTESGSGSLVTTLSPKQMTPDVNSSPTIKHSEGVSFTTTTSTATLVNTQNHLNDISSSHPSTTAASSTVNLRDNVITKINLVHTTESFDESLTTSASNIRQEATKSQTATMTPQSKQTTAKVSEFPPLTPSNGKTTENFPPTATTSAIKQATKTTSDFITTSTTLITPQLSTSNEDLSDKATFSPQAAVTLTTNTHEQSKSSTVIPYLHTSDLARTFESATTSSAYTTASSTSNRNGRLTTPFSTTDEQLKLSTITQDVNTRSVTRQAFSTGSMNSPVNSELHVTTDDSLTTVSATERPNQTIWHPTNIFTMSTNEPIKMTTVNSDNAKTSEYSTHKSPVITTNEPIKMTTVNSDNTKTSEYLTNKSAVFTTNEPIKMTTVNSDNTKTSEYLTHKSPVITTNEPIKMTTVNSDNTKTSEYLTNKSAVFTTNEPIKMTTVKSDNAKTSETSRATAHDFPISRPTSSANIEEPNLTTSKNNIITAGTSTLTATTSTPFYITEDFSTDRKTGGLTTSSTTPLTTTTANKLSTITLENQKPEFSTINLRFTSSITSSQLPSSTTNQPPKLTTPLENASPGNTRSTEYLTTEMHSTSGPTITHMSMTTEAKAGRIATSFENGPTKFSTSNPMITAFTQGFIDFSSSNAQTRETSKRISDVTTGPLTESEVKTSISTSQASVTPTKSDSVTYKATTATVTASPFEDDVKKTSETLSSTATPKSSSNTISSSTTSHPALTTDESITLSKSVSTPKEPRDYTTSAFPTETPTRETVATQTLGVFSTSPSTMMTNEHSTSSTTKETSYSSSFTTIKSIAPSPVTIDYSLSQMNQSIQSTSQSIGDQSTQSSSVSATTRSSWTTFPSTDRSEKLTTSSQTNSTSTKNYFSTTASTGEEQTSTSKDGFTISTDSSTTATISTVITQFTKPYNWDTTNESTNHTITYYDEIITSTPPPIINWTTCSYSQTFCLQSGKCLWNEHDEDMDMNLQRECMGNGECESRFKKCNQLPVIDRRSCSPTEVLCLESGSFISCPRRNDYASDFPEFPYTTDSPLNVPPQDTKFRMCPAEGVLHPIPVPVVCIADTDCPFRSTCCYRRPGENNFCVWVIDNKKDCPNYFYYCSVTKACHLPMTPCNDTCPPSWEFCPSLNRCAAVGMCNASGDNETNELPFDFPNDISPILSINNPKPFSEDSEIVMKVSDVLQLGGKVDYPMAMKETYLHRFFNEHLKWELSPSEYKKWLNKFSAFLSVKLKTVLVQSVFIETSSLPTKDIYEPFPCQDSDIALEIINAIHPQAPFCGESEALKLKMRHLLRMRTTANFNGKVTVGVVPEVQDISGSRFRGKAGELVVIINPVDDAPVINWRKADLDLEIPNVTKVCQKKFGFGVRVSDIVSAYFKDFDGNQLGMAILSAQATSLGFWQFRLPDGEWIDILDIDPTSDLYRLLKIDYNHQGFVSIDGAVVETTSMRIRRDLQLSNGTSTENVDGATSKTAEHPFQSVPFGQFYPYFSEDYKAISMTNWRRSPVTDPETFYNLTDISEINLDLSWRRRKPKFPHVLSCSGRDALNDEEVFTNQTYDELDGRPVQLNLEESDNSIDGRQSGTSSPTNPTSADTQMHTPQPSQTYTANVEVTHKPEGYSSSKSTDKPTSRADGSIVVTSMPRDSGTNGFSSTTNSQIIATNSPTSTTQRPASGTNVSTGQTTNPVAMTNHTLSSTNSPTSTTRIPDGSTRVSNIPNAVPNSPNAVTNNPNGITNYPNAVTNSRVSTAESSIYVTNSPTTRINSPVSVTSRSNNVVSTTNSPASATQSFTSGAQSTTRGSSSSAIGVQTPTSGVTNAPARGTISFTSGTSSPAIESIKHSTGTPSSGPSWSQTTYNSFSSKATTTSAPKPTVAVFTTESPTTMATTVKPNYKYIEEDERFHESISLRERKALFLPPSAMLRFSPRNSTTGYLSLPWLSLMDALHQSKLAFLAWAPHDDGSVKPIKDTVDIQLCSKQNQSCTSFNASLSAQLVVMHLRNGDERNATSLIQRRGQDVCDVCGGNGDTCLDCNGVSNGGSYVFCGRCIKGREMSSACENGAPTSETASFERCDPQDNSSFIDQCGNCRTTNDSIKTQEICGRCLSSVDKRISEFQLKLFDCNNTWQRNRMTEGVSYGMQPHLRWHRIGNRQPTVYIDLTSLNGPKLLLHIYGPSWSYKRDIFSKGECDLINAKAEVETLLTAQVMEDHVQVELVGLTVVTDHRLQCRLMTEQGDYYTLSPFAKLSIVDSRHILIRNVSPNSLDVSQNHTLSIDGSGFLNTSELTCFYMRYPSRQAFRLSTARFINESRVECTVASNTFTEGMTIDVGVVYSYATIIQYNM